MMQKKMPIDCTSMGIFFCKLATVVDCVALNRIFAKSKWGSSLMKIVTASFNDSGVFCILIISPNIVRIYFWN